MDRDWALESAARSLGLTCVARTLVLNMQHATVMSVYEDTEEDDGMIDLEMRSPLVSTGSVKQGSDGRDKTLDMEVSRGMCDVHRVMIASGPVVPIRATGVACVLRAQPMHRDAPVHSCAVSAPVAVGVVRGDLTKVCGACVVRVVCKHAHGACARHWFATSSQALQPRCASTEPSFSMMQQAPGTSGRSTPRRPHAA